MPQEPLTSSSATQTVALPHPLVAVAKALERSGPLARLALRVRFTYLAAPSRLSRELDGG